jgi:ligand-binding SRPBCC domain-containing protein
MLRYACPAAPVKFHTLRRQQQIPRPLDEVFAFFSDARNLEAITPPWLGFRTLTPGPIQLARGTQIRYRLRIHGAPVNWTTEIRRWDPPRRFVDVQLSGPYQLWHHTHRFENSDGGTRMIDVVRYRLALGPLGRLVNILMVGRDIDRIFDYRNWRIAEIFGSVPETRPAVRPPSRASFVAALNRIDACSGQIV